MNRLPIRLRLTGTFVLAMAVVLTAVGAVLHQRLGSSMTEQIDDRLRAQTDALLAFARPADLRATLTESGPSTGETFVKVVWAGEEFTSSGFRGIPSVSPGAGRDAEFVEFAVVDPDGETEPARALTTRVDRAGGPLTIIVGESLSDRRDALRGLLTQMWILGPIALVIASLLGDLVSRAALRPVEQMRRRAELIGVNDAGGRLPLPRADDEIRRLGATLNAMLDRLDTSLRRERRFVADASHELRTPLALLRTELELATRKARSADELTSAIDSAKEEVERLVRLAEDLLVLASADEGHLAVRPARIDAKELLDTVARRFAARAELAGRTIVTDAAAMTGVWGDRARLEQALGNIVDNALRDGAGTISLRATTAATATELTVTDEGPGFPDALLRTAFERFTRADGVRIAGATGLGLAIVQAIATAHGGTATAENHPTTVTLRLPNPHPTPAAAGV